MIYLDHNSTTNLLEEAKEAMIGALAKPLNASAIHVFGREGKRIMEKSRRQIAELVGIYNNFRDYHVTFTASGTEANNLILANFRQGEIFVSSIEHASILEHARRENNIHLIAVDENGILNQKVLEALLAKSSAAKKLVSVMLANNETGVVQNIREIAGISRQYGALVHSDCAQAAGKIPVDLIEMGVDFATLSAHKIGGPPGAGALIGKTQHHLIPHIIGGGQEKGLRSGTENVASIAGFGAAAEVAKKDQKANYENLKNLRDYMENRLVQEFPCIKIVSQAAARLPNTSMIIHQGKKAETRIIAFDLKNIAISSGAACSSGKVGSSATLSAMGFDEEDKAAAIRVSLGFTTTKKDIDQFLETYREING